MVGGPEPDAFERMRSIYLAAVQLEGDAQAAFLEDACRDDPSMRAEVEDLLGIRPPEFLAESSAGLPLAEVMADLQETIPESIAEYRIEGFLGRGGMGIVYRAAQERPSRNVALKVLQPGLVHGDALERFVQEAEVLGALQHPGIASVFAAGTFESGLGELPYFAMELVDGRSLNRFVTDHALDTEGICRLLIQACEAMQHAHERGVVHRDLKPNNILVIGSASAPQLKILDFGIARSASAGDGSDMRTRTGQMFGTIPYMSPEQFEGRPEAIDARTDIYALGVVLYELIAGSLPFDVFDVPLTEAARIVQTVEAPRLRRARSTVSKDLETVVGCALAKERDARYPTARALAADLERLLDRRPIQARPATRLYRARKFVQRNRALVGGVAATFVVLLGGLIGMSILAVTNRRLADAEGELRLELRETLYSMQWESLGREFEAPSSTKQLKEVASGWPDPIFPEAELRGWEYDFVSSVASSARRNKLGHAVHQVTWTRQDRVVIAAGMGLLELKGRPFQHAEPLPDRNLVAASAVDPVSGLTAWVQNGTLHWQSDSVGSGSLAVPGDSDNLRVGRTHMITGRSKGGRWFADLRGPTIVHHLEITEGRYGAGIGFAPDDDRVALASLDEPEVRIIDTKTWEVLDRFPTGPVPARMASWSPDGSALAVGRTDQNIDLWNLESRRRRTMPTIAHGNPRRCRWSPDSLRVAVVHENAGAVRIYDPDGPCLDLRGPTSTVTSVAWSPDGDQLVVGDFDGNLWTWDLEGPVTILEPQSMSASGGPEVKWSADGAILYAGRNHLGFWCYDSHTGERIEGSPDDPRWYDEKGELSFTTYGDQRTVVRVKTGETCCSIPATSDGSYPEMKWIPGGHRLLMAAGDDLWVLDGPTGRELGRASGAVTRGRTPAVLSSIAFDREGRRFWLCQSRSQGMDLVEWTLDDAEGAIELTPRRIARLPSTRALAVSPAGNLTVACTDETIRVVRPDNGVEISRFEAPPGERIAWHPDGRRLVTAGQMWDTDTGRPVFSCWSPDCEAAWSPDGSALAVVGLEGRIRLWRAVRGR